MFVKSAVLSALGVGIVALIALNIPFTRRRILNAADRLADWHERGTEQGTELQENQDRIDTKS